MTTRERLWTRAYFGLLITVCLAYSHQALLTPTIPLYVKDLGGSTLMAGLVLLAFSVPSFATRPFLGYLADSRGVFVVLTAGTLLLGITGFLHVPRILPLVFAASALRGVGWAGLNTGGFSLLAHIAPMQRRGEAASYYNMFFAAPNALFPAVALFLIDRPHAGFTLVLILSGVFGIAAMVSSLVIPRKGVETVAPTAGEQRRLRLSELFDPAA